MEDRNTRQFQSRLIAGAIIAVILGTTLWFSGPVSREVGERLEKLKQEGIGSLELFLNRKIGYASVSPSIFSFIEIRDLTLFTDLSGTERLLSISKVRVHYDILDFIRGDFAGGIRDIVISGTTLSFDTETDTDIIDLFRTGRGGGEPIPFSLPRIIGRNINLSISHPFADFTLTNLFFQISEGETDYRIQIKSAINGTLETAETESPLPRRFATEFAVSGTVGKGFDSGDVKVSLRQIEADHFTVSPQTLRITLNDQTVSFVKVQDRAPIDIQGSFSFPEKELKLSFISERFRPQSFVSVDSRYASLAPWLSVRISGKGTVSYRFSERQLGYAGTIAVSGSNQLLGGDFSCRTYLKGDGERVDFSFLSFQCPYGNVDFYGSLDIARLVPMGRADIRTTVMGKELSTTMFISEGQDGYTIFAQYINFGRDQILGSVLSLSRNDDGFDYLLTGSMSGGKSGNQFSIEGSFYPGDTPFLQASATIRDLPIQTLLSMGTKPDLPILSGLVPPYSISMDLFLSTDFSKFSFASPRVSIVDENGSEVLSFAAMGNNDEISVKGLTAQWNEMELKGEILLSILPDSYILSVQGGMGEIGYLMDIVFIPETGIFISGENGIDGAVLFRDKETAFSLITRNLPIPFFDTIPELSINLKGTYIDKDQWEFFLYDTRIANLPIPTAQNMITLTGRFSSRESTITYISYVDSVSSYSGNGLLAIDSLNRSRGSGWVSLSNMETGESLQIRGEVRESYVDISAFFKSINLNRFTKIQISGHLSGEARVIGARSGPDIYMNLVLPDGNLSGKTLALQGIYSLTADRLSIDRMTATYGTHRMTEIAGYMIPDTGKFQVGGEYSGIVGQGPLKGSIAISGATAPVEKRSLLLSSFSDAFSATIELTNIVLKGEKKPSWLLTGVKSPDGMIISGGPSDAVYCSIKPDGSITARLSDPLPVRFNLDGYVHRDNLDLSLNDIHCVLPFVFDLVKIPEYAITEGIGTGNLRITGSPKDPDFSGSLFGTGAYSETRFIPEPLGPYSARFDFSGKTISATDVVVKTASSTVLADVNLTMDHWVPRGYHIWLRTVDPKGVHVQYDSASIVAIGYGVGELSIYDIPDGTKIAGDFVINSCVVNLGDRETAEQPRKKPSSGLDVELHLTTGQRVEFLWPTATIPILRAFADTEQVITILYNEVIDSLAVTGTVNVKGGEIFYFKRNFYLKEGMIKFNEYGDKFDPVLSARAEIREVDDEGEQVKIYLIVDNEPLSQFSPVFEAEPFLSDNEIFSILGTSIYSELGGDDLSLETAATFGADIVSQLSIVRTFEQKVKEIFNLDLFSVRTEIIQTLIRENLFAGDPIGNTEYTTLGRYLDNTTVFLGKYFGNDIFVEAMFQINADNKVLGGYYQSDDLTIDTELSFEWKTPLFLLDVTYAPDLGNLRDTYLDLSLGLSWAYSF